MAIDKRFLFVECACGREFQTLAKNGKDWDAQASMTEALRHFATCAKAQAEGVFEAMAQTFERYGWALPEGVSAPQRAEVAAGESARGWVQADVLPAFSDDEARCDKCMSPDALAVAYCAGGVLGNGPRQIVCGLGVSGEHLHRRCARCGFEFGEQVASAE